MTPEQIARVRTSWTQFVPISEPAAARFYERLFTLDPSLRALFVRADPATQQRKLVQALAIVVAALDDLPGLAPGAAALGAQHVGYGVKPEHYATLGEALLWTLATTLGDSFDAPTHDAWAAAYDILASAMIAGASTVAVAT